MSTLVEERDEEPLVSHFAPAERTPAVSLRARARRVTAHPMVPTVLDAIADYALLLDARRQILFANPAFCRALGISDAEDLIGRRVGDVLGCERACVAPNGCGTSRACGRCGALLTMLSARDAERTVSGHCVMSLRRNGIETCVEFSVRVTRACFDDEPLWICLLSDVTATRRRELLDRLFLHDSRNVLQGLLGWGEWLHQSQPSEASSRNRRLGAAIESWRSRSSSSSHKRNSAPSSCNGRATA
ncbi:MAG: PAS domain-containing protein [Polyangiaceae bacterium]